MKKGIKLDAQDNRPPQVLPRPDLPRKPQDLPKKPLKLPDARSDKPKVTNRTVPVPPTSTTYTHGRRNTYGEVTMVQEVQCHCVLWL